MLVAGQSAAAAAVAVRPVKVAQPAGFWVRLVAFIIDIAILNAVAVGVYYVWQGTLTPANVDPNHLAASLQTNLTYQVAAFELAVGLLNLFYFAGSWTILGASPAQRIFNLHIIGKNGQPIGFLRGCLRYIVLSWLGLPTALVVALSKSKRGLHDRIAGTYVIQYLDPERIEGDPEKNLPAGLSPQGEQPSPAAAPPAPAPVPAATAPGPPAAVVAGAMVAAEQPPRPLAAPAQPASVPPPLAQQPPLPQATAPAIAPYTTAAAPQVPGLAPLLPPTTLQPGPAPAAAAAPPAATPFPTPPLQPAVGAIPAPAQPIDPTPAQALLPEPPAAPIGPAMAPMPESAATTRPAADTSGGREIYSPAAGQVPALVTIDPYPVPFGPAPAVDVPPVAPPPPHPAAEPPPA
jgi:uncharacterized RDD family membrane protein YckC